MLNEGSQFNFSHEANLPMCLQGDSEAICFASVCDLFRLRGDSAALAFAKADRADAHSQLPLSEADELSAVATP